MICATCGHEAAEPFKFCPECGSPATASEAARELRKVVTVVFCDVTGSTALGERLDSESLRKVMERYFGVARDVVERHGGTVEKFIGDAVMAVFGVPSVHEDDALRAARASFELRARLADLNGELREGFGVELTVRIGINTGEVVTSVGGTLATGDAVNVAARLEQAAQPGEILIGERTRQLAAEAVELEPLPPLDAKGKSEPLVAYRLLGLREDAPAFARRFDAPFVGRESELAHLEQTFERAVRDRSCHLFTALAPAGIGKSRLTYEFLATKTDATVLSGRCLAYGEGITYFPLVEVLEAIAADPDLVGLIERDADARRILNQVSSAVGLADDPALSREETFHAVRQLFETIAAARPLIVVFDDLHWAEPTFLDLVDYVVDWSREAPIFLLCLARPDLLDARPSWAGGKLHATTTLLEPLSAEESETLMDNLVAGVSLSSAMRRRIADTAEGNPLFVEQMLALIAADGGDGELEVPPTIQALLATRLEQLPTPERVAAERAAVVGKEFWRAALVELGGEPGALPPLVRKELIRPHRSLLFPGEEAFRFRHLLIRDAAYENMPKELRAKLHERFAQWLEQSRSEYDEIVGYHFEQAYRLREQLGPIDDNARELALRAGQLLGRAGHRAYERGDLPAAANLLGRATALLPDSDRLRLGLLVQLGYVLKDGGELERSKSVFASASQRAVELGDRATEIRARIGDHWTSAQIGGGTTGDCRPVARELETLEELRDEVGLAEGYAVLAAFQAWAGQSEAASRSFDRAIEHARSAGSRRLATISIGFQVMLEAWGHLPAEAGLRRCDELLAEHGGTATEAFIRAARSNYLSFLGQADDASAEVTQSLAIHRARAAWRHRSRGRALARGCRDHRRDGLAPAARRGARGPGGGPAAGRACRGSGAGAARVERVLRAKAVPPRRAESEGEARGARLVGCSFFSGVQAQRPAKRLSGSGPDEEPGGRLLADRLLRAVDPDRELARGRLRRAELELRARNEALVVEPVQELAVVLGQADDRGVDRRLEVGERGQIAVLGALGVGIDGPAVRAAVRMAEFLLDPLDHLVREGVAELVSVHVGLGGGIAHEVGQEPLDDPVLADDLLGAFAPARGQDRLLLLAALDQALGLEALQHLAGRGPGDAEHLGDAGGERGVSGRAGAVLPDRKGEEVDRLQVLIDRMSLRHGAQLYWPFL
ncbi:MAG TPA: adenylate/guanylate cyclase domain-containing protein [Gaiellaceae bacterium]